MSTATQCENAAEYAVRELQEADRPLTPKQLAERYECGGDHMRGVLADLVEPGVVERPERGKYVISDAYADTDLRVRNAGSGAPEVEAAHGEDDLASQEELYQRQHREQTPDMTGEDHAVPVEAVEESSDESTEDHAEDHAETTPEAGGRSLPEGSGIVVATLLFAAYVLMQVSGGDGGEETSTEDTSEQQEQQAEDTGTGVPLIE
jgi:hypothetical protein